MPLPGTFPMILVGLYHFTSETQLKSHGWKLFSLKLSKDIIEVKDVTSMARTKHFFNGG